MALQIFEIAVNQTLGGRTQSDIYTNILHIRTAHEVDENEFFAMANALAIKWSKAMLPKARILNIVCTELDEGNSYKAVEGQFRTIPVNRSGARVMPNGYHAAPFDICCDFVKGGSMGKTGHTRLRGCLSMAEITAGDDLAFTTVPDFDPTEFDDFTTGFAALFAEFEMELVLPPSGDKNGIPFLWRPVTSFAFTGVSQKQRRNSTQSLEQQKNNLFKRALNELVSIIEKTVINMGGPLPAALFEAVRDRVIPFLEEWGYERIAKIKLPDIVRNMINLAHALLPTIPIAGN